MSYDIDKCDVMLCNCDAVAMTVMVIRFRAGHIAVGHGTDIIVYGGYHSDRQVFADVNVFNTGNHQ